LPGLAGLARLVVCGRVWRRLAGFVGFAGFVGCVCFAGVLIALDLLVKVFVEVLK
jgi:hypothetical protein